MDAETRAKKFTELHRDLLATYTLVINLLERLPVRMSLPRTQGDEPETAIRSLSRAWELAGLEPLTALEIGRLRAMINAWLTAYEVACMARQAGPAAWRLVAIEEALITVRVSARYLDAHLAEYGR